MKFVDIKTIKQNPAERMRFLGDFMGFSDDDRQAIRESAGVIAPHLQTIVDNIYDHLLGWDDTSNPFMGGMDVSDSFIEIRKDHLTMWLLKSCDAPDPEMFAPYLTHIGLVHTSHAGDPRRTTPPRYMVTLMSVIHTGVAKVLTEVLHDEPAKAIRMIMAWQRTLFLQLELILKAMVPSFPTWDEE